MAQKTIESTTQQFLDIYDITNDLVIMKDGTTSCILTVDAMNFGLLAEEEQDAIMYAYAGLLNSLNYPIQVIIRSQTKDVTGYLHLLEEQENQAETRENQQRIRRYREFVSNLIHERNVLDKKFYVVIPATPLELGMLSAQSVIPGSQTFDASQVEKTVIIEKAHNLLDPKRDHLVSQFARIGLYSRALTTQEIIQLFYMSYNPEASEGQHIGESKSYTTSLVKASVERFPMINANSNPVPTPPDATSTGQPPAQPVTPVAPAVPATNQVSPTTEQAATDRSIPADPNMAGVASDMSTPVIEQPAPSTTPATANQASPTPGVTTPTPAPSVATPTPTPPVASVQQAPVVTQPTQSGVTPTPSVQSTQPETAGAPQPITTPPGSPTPDTTAGVADTTSTTSASATTPSMGSTTRAPSPTQSEPDSKSNSSSSSSQDLDEQTIINQVVGQAGDTTPPDLTSVTAPSQASEDKKPTMPPVAEI